MVGIIYIGNISRCPYLKYYTESLDKKQLDYEIIYWDRNSRMSENSNRNNATKVHIFEYLLKDQRKDRKIIAFYKYSKFVRKIIKEKKYEKLVILTTMTAMLLLPELYGDYKKKYIFDYRDASYEYIKPFYMLISKIIQNSYFTCISSKGFLEILPKNQNYIMAHNISSNEVTTHISMPEKTKYIVGYIGGLRSTTYMKMLVDIFGDDDRFELIVNGGGDNYQDMVNYSKRFNNIIFTGPYNENEKRDLLKNIDIICYNYPESFNHNVALANKYYDGLIERKPLLGNINTYSGQLIKNNEIGISLNFKDSVYKDKLYDYLKQLDYKSFIKKCDLLIQEVQLDNELFVQKIMEFLCH